MNTFTVERESQAENALAQIFLDAAEPLAVTQAQARIDQVLASNPIGNGRLLSEGLYRIAEGPLVVNYTVDAV